MTLLLLLLLPLPLLGGAVVDSSLGTSSGQAMETESAGSVLSCNGNGDDVVVGGGGGSGFWGGV